jgi:hypothetical protein
MSIERLSVSGKVSQQNLDFLDEWRREFFPVDVTRSTLINACVTIVRELHASDGLPLKPKALVNMLENIPGWQRKYLKTPALH